MDCTVFILTISASFFVLFLRCLNFLRKTIVIRRSWKRLPGAPRSFFNGNLGNLVPLVPPDRHLDYGLYAIWKGLGRPKWFLVDLWPRQLPLICIADPKIAEQLTRATADEPESTPKMSVPECLRILIGATSVSTAQGQEWQHVRQRINPFFRPNVIYSALGRIVDHTDVFVDRLLVAARAEADVRLGDLLADLATDVISSCVVAHEMGCQTSADGEREKGPNGLFTCLRDSVAIQPQFFGSGLSASVRRVLAKRKLKHYQRTLNIRIASIIQQDTKAGFAAKFIGSEPWTPSLLRQCVDQFKTLILAGQDTTACALQWCFFYLWKHPEVLWKLRCEHDVVLGTDRENASARLREEPQLLQRLPYTTAVIKETLRLRGISGTTRELAKEVLIDADGEKVPLETGAICYVNNFLLMKNPEYWGMDAEDFRPSRFLEDWENSKEAGGGGLDQQSPRMRHIAYRPFERGPRNCIGQELSMLEMRIVLVLTVRRFNFFKRGLDGVHEEEVYDISRVVHSPVDRMKMRFEERTDESNTG
ncbi:AflN protein [Colletotrichum musicola]|uniref:AflN protein n=1 Tax=Colletotrichum musicola TaxID=2175873 RepID=A0A8H6JM01_9PEZI|nr:AflN protein [Colletotrichum musicola]